MMIHQEIKMVASAGYIKPVEKLRELKQQWEKDKSQYEAYFTFEHYLAMKLENV